MNRHQRVAVTIAAANLLLILLFPPFDQHSAVNAVAPTFAGFYFILNPPLFGQINSSVLTLEVMVVVVNAGIAWLLLRGGTRTVVKPKLRLQNAVLVATGANLILMLLFPPFTTVFALAEAVPPSFEGFHFILSLGPNHAISTSMLYMEVAFILVNGGLFWLSFNEGI